MDKTENVDPLGVVARMTVAFYVAQTFNTSPGDALRAVDEVRLRGEPPGARITPESMIRYADEALALLGAERMQRL